MERLLTFEHVEDSLMDKRVVTRDEHWEQIPTLLAMLRGGPPVALVAAINATIHAQEPVIVEHEKITRNTLRRITEVNLSRRNFLLLRDFSDKRPWLVASFFFFGKALEARYSLTV